MLIEVVQEAVDKTGMAQVPVADRTRLLSLLSAVLMLSFYANTCLGHFKAAYLCCQNLKASVLDLMMIVAGTVSDSWNRTAARVRWACRRHRAPS